MCCPFTTNNSLGSFTFGKSSSIKYLVLTSLPIIKSKGLWDTLSKYWKASQAANFSFQEKIYLLTEVG